MTKHEQLYGNLRTQTMAQLYAQFDGQLRERLGEELYWNLIDPICAHVYATLLAGLHE